MASAADERVLRVLDVTIDETRSTFRLTHDNRSIHAGIDDKVRIGVEFDRTMLQAFENASCIGMEGEQPIEDALPIWRDLLKKRGRDDLARNLSDYDGYQALIKKGGSDAFVAARPSQAEISSLRKNQPELYEIILKWMVKCVGVSSPVLIWTIENRTAKELTLYSVSYNKLDVGQVMGVGPDTVEPIDVLPHELSHSTGVEEDRIMPRIRVAPGGQAAIRIKYIMESTESGYTWLIKPTFMSLEGVSAVGPEIKIFNAKRG